MSHILNSLSKEPITGDRWLRSKPLRVFVFLKADDGPQCESVKMKKKKRVKEEKSPEKHDKNPPSGRKRKKSSSEHDKAEKNKKMKKDGDPEEKKKKEKGKKDEESDKWKWYVCAGFLQVVFNHPFDRFNSSSVHTVNV